MQLGAAQTGKVKYIRKQFMIGHIWRRMNDSVPSLESVLLIELVVLLPSTIDLTASATNPVPLM